MFETGSKWTPRSFLLAMDQHALSARIETYVRDGDLKLIDDVVLDQELSPELRAMGIVQITSVETGEKTQISTKREKEIILSHYQDGEDYYALVIKDGVDIALCCRFAAEHGVTDGAAAAMLEAGVLERVETTAGPTLIVVDGLSLEEARKAAKAWAMLQPGIRPWVLEQL